MVQCIARLKQAGGLATVLLTSAGGLAIVQLIVQKACDLCNITDLYSPINPSPVTEVGDAIRCAGQVQVRCHTGTQRSHKNSYVSEEASSAACLECQMAMFITIDMISNQASVWILWAQTTRQHTHCKVGVLPHSKNLRGYPSTKAVSPFEHHNLSQLALLPVRCLHKPPQKAEVLRKCHGNFIDFVRRTI